MHNFARISCPDCLGSLICGLYYIKESLFGTFCRPKYSTGSRGKTPNAERRMHCLLAASFTCVCLRLAFTCWKGQHFIVVGPF